MSYRFYSNTTCEYYPCKEVDPLNCLFCFCPLYHFSDCGGTYTMLPNGVKDCSGCTRPHESDGYDYIIARLMRETPTRFVGKPTRD